VRERKCRKTKKRKGKKERKKERKEEKKGRRRKEGGDGRLAWGRPGSGAGGQGRPVAMGGSPYPWQK